MKKIKLLFAAIAISVFGAFAFAPVATVGAQLNPLDSACEGVGSGENEFCDNKDDDAMDLIKPIINVLLFIVGTLSVIMIIVSGVLYVTSTGDAGKVAKAKNTLTYSIVGLIVAFIAFAVVNWVVELFV